MLAVNAGSTSLKLHLVDGEEATAVDGWLAADAVGHRVVHGGERFRAPVEIDDEVEAAIAQLATIAPLHNLPALAAIRDARLALGDVPHVAVFDTAFHATMPDRASTYAVPSQWREWGIRRYGFHGLSVEWVAGQVPVSRLVVCHLGGGCSVTAVLDGRSVDTSMGFSPLEGVPMGTRSGSVDPGALLYLLRERGVSPDELDHALEHESGLLALGGSSDPRELVGTPALDLYAYRVATTVGAMAVALGGLDALAFTGGVGEGSADVRDRVCEQLAFLGDFDVVVVPAREELVIARAVRRLLAP
ncbi:MAG: acetate/propionate family kinase [Actinomycetota bacterium]